MAFNLTMKSKTAEATVSLSTAAIQHFLNVSSPVLIKRTTVPILKYARIFTQSGVGYLRLTNLDCYVDMAIQSSGIGEIDLAIEYSALSDILSKAPKCMLLVEREGNTLTFKMNSTIYGKIECAPGKDCPSLIIPLNTQEGGVQLTDFDISFVHKYVARLCIEDNEYTALRGILLELSGNSYGFAATDRNMLIYTNLVENALFRCALPPVAFKIASLNGESGILYLYKEYYRFECGKVAVYGKYFGGGYPDFHKLVYTEYDHEHKVNVGELRKELKRLCSITPFTDKGICPVMLTYDSEYLWVKPVPDDYEYDKGGVKMDAVRILELLERFDDNSTVAFKSSRIMSRPSLWIDNRATTMFMPLR